LVSCFELCDELEKYRYQKYGFKKNINIEKEVIFLRPSQQKGSHVEIKVR
jgi:hypothetical protein